MELLKKMKYELETFGGTRINKARLYHDFLILLMFATVNPARNTDMIRLKIVQEKDEERDKKNNYLIFKEDGTVELEINIFKTSSTYGCNRISVSSVDYLERYLRTFIDKERRILLKDKKHDFLFMRKSGEPFESSESFTVYLSKSFSQHSDDQLHVTTGTLRKSLVNWVLSEEKDKNIEAAIARLMSHSQRTQRLRYYTMETENKIKKGVRHLADNTANWLGIRRKLSCWNYPIKDQIVALITNDSTLAVPNILVGKVIDVNYDEKTVLMAEMEETDESYTYKMKIGITFNESIEAVVHPIDCVYDADTNTYHLRTRKHEIHEAVMEGMRQQMDESSSESDNDFI